MGRGGSDQQAAPGRALRVGLISDTHGLLRPGALEALRGCDHIVHGGDIGHAGILQALAALAPVTAVRGNNDDPAGWAAGLPDTAELTLGGRRLYLIHDLAQLGIADPAAAGIDVVVHGHSHRPGAEQRGGVWYVNPGSAGPRRFRLPISLGELRIGADGAIDVRLVALDA